MSSHYKKISTRELCFIALFVALISVCAQVTVPQPGGVPFTLQAWAVALAGLVLGPKNGMWAALVYVLLGALGVPVFAGFSGGFGVILRPTGGFLLSFPVMALLAGWGEKKGGLVWPLLGLGAGTVFNWACGMLYFSWVTSLSLLTSFGYAVAPFIIVGVVRTAALPFIGKSIKTAIRKAGITV
jgi:biotin transport system substrate-specific component